MTNPEVAKKLAKRIYETLQRETIVPENEKTIVQKIEPVILEVLDEDPDEENTLDKLKEEGKVSEMTREDLKNEDEWNIVLEEILDKKRDKKSPERDDFVANMNA